LEFHRWTYANTFQIFPIALCIPPLLVVGSIGYVGKTIDIPQLGTVSDVSALLSRNPPNVKHSKIGTGIIKDQKNCDFKTEVLKRT
jgi:hypothetical protein